MTPSLNSSKLMLPSWSLSKWAMSMAAEASAFRRSRPSCCMSLTTSLASSHPDPSLSTSLKAAWSS
eukprot:CAMPEP_0175325366 /NCGR_PEP_ID=MMETSP0093-20121207/73971_1 /TAXON_ID=311494 /ORGANISM="Alexandrium monilatum, Strain CCMP3105" /LENGTH=65 /DNA_ID=CAMNT_0016622319 /DNA_START=27 /DNA_END=220 /DNA_ORIENTATION=-